jgi:hypothetical protein
VWHPGYIRPPTARPAPDPAAAGNRARTPRTPAVSCSAWLGSPQRHARRPPARHTTWALHSAGRRRGVPRPREANGASPEEPLSHAPDRPCVPPPTRAAGARRTPRGPGRPGHGTHAPRRSRRLARLEVPGDGTALPAPHTAPMETGTGGAARTRPTREADRRDMRSLAHAPDPRRRTLHCARPRRPGPLCHRPNQQKFFSWRRDSSGLPNGSRLSCGRA